MKNLILLLIVLVVACMYCKTESSTTEKEITEVKERNSEDNTLEDENTEDEKNESSHSLSIDLDNIDLKDIKFEKGKIIPTDDLKALFPKRLGRMDKTDLSAESSGAFGFNIATVSADYKNDDKKIKLELIDFGGIPAVASLIAAWTKSDIHHEDEDGFEKVSEWKGYKSFEKWDKKDNNSSLTILYKDRLLVNASAKDIGLDDLKEIIEDDFLDELQDLKIEKK